MEINDRSPPFRMGFTRQRRASSCGSSAFQSPDIFKRSSVRRLFLLRYSLLSVLVHFSAELTNINVSRSGDGDTAVPSGPG